MEDAEGGVGGGGGDEEGDWRGGSDALVQKGYAEESAAEGSEEAERGYYGVGRRGGGETDKGATPGEEWLGGREGCTKEGVGVADGFEGGVCGVLVKDVAWEKAGHRPGVDAEVDLPMTSMVLLSVEGVACTEMYLYPPTRRPARKCAGNAHLCGCAVRRSRLLEGMSGIFPDK